jgi:PilZ domain
MEHRWGHRMNADMAVRLVAAPAAVGAGRLINVSVTGAFVRTNLALAPLAQVHVELADIHAPLPRSVRLAAYVVRSTKLGIGLEWSDPGPCVFALLRPALPEEARIDPGSQIGADGPAGACAG